MADCVVVGSEFANGAVVFGQSVINNPHGLLCDGWGSTGPVLLTDLTTQRLPLGKLITDCLSLGRRGTQGSPVCWRRGTGVCTIQLWRWGHASYHHLLPGVAG